ncbi:MAG: TonB-dependent receptor [Flavitalea sp.]
MKKTMLLFVMVFFTMSAFAQLKGKIFDQQTCQPIAFATIQLGNGQTINSREDGSFQIRDLPKNPSVLISSVGYKSLRDTIRAGQDNLFGLTRYDLFMQPVEVRATRAGDKAPFTKTNISKAEIEKVNLGQDLPFLLNQTPSVIVNSDAGNGVGYTGIRIRGSDATRINMTINGIPYNDAESQGLFFVNMPDLASSLQSIQVQRGVGTSSNGAGAFGATMNFSTNEVIPEAYAEFNNSYGSFNTWKNTIKAGTGLIDGQFTVDARLSRITSDGYIDRATSDLKSFYLSTGWIKKNTSLRFNILSGQEKTYQAWNGVSQADLKTNRTVNYAGMERPGEPYKNETDNYQQDHYQFFINHKFSERFTFNTAMFLTKGKGYYEQYKADREYAEYGLPDYKENNVSFSETDLVRQLWLDNNFYGQVFSFLFKDDKNQLDFGGGWNRYDGNHFGEVTWAERGVPNGHRWYDHDARKTDLNSYVKYQRKLSSNLYLFGDLQFRNVNYRIDGFRDNPGVSVNNSYNFFNPKYGVTYIKGNSQAYLSYSKAAKEPNRDDFEAGGTEQPRPEKLHDFELGYEYKTQETQLQATLYYMKYNDQLVLTGRVNDVGAYTRTNIDNSYRMGIELQAGKRISNAFRITGNIAFSENKIDNFIEYFDDYDNGGQKSISHGKTDIAFSPSIIAGYNLEWNISKGFQLNLPGKYVSRQYLDNTSDKSRSLDPYFVKDLRLSYTVNTKVAREISIIFQLSNVFNKKYEPNGYTYSYLYNGSITTENFYYPMAGTNFMAGVNIKL